MGEEQLSREIAKAITVHRKNKKIEKTGELTEIILNTYREKLHSEKEIPWIGGLHPATKVFQALRIEVNHELENLKLALPQAVEILASGGRLAVITFHSLEDRIVKQYFKSIENKQSLKLRQGSKEENWFSSLLTSSNYRQIKLINKKPIIASEVELEANPRASSAKLRVVEKI